MDAPFTHASGSHTSFDIDTRDILAMAYNFEQGPKVAQRELLKGMRLATEQTRTITRTGMPYRSGLMQAKMPTKVTQTASSVMGRIDFTAKSPKGFPYPVAMNDGRGAIRPKNKKWLRFRGSDGEIVFTKYVKPFVGLRFAEKGLARSAGAITKAMDNAIDRIIRYLGTSR